VIAITVEDEGDIAKFKDYEPSTSGAGAGAGAVQESPAPPKKEVVEQLLKIAFSLALLPENWRKKTMLVVVNALTEIFVWL